MRGSAVARAETRRGEQVPAEFNDRPRWGAACRGQRPRPIILELSESALRFLAPLHAAPPPPPLPLPATWRILCTPISPLLLSLPPHASASTTEPTSRTDSRQHSVVTSAAKVERGIRPGRCVERHARVARRNRVAGCRRSHAHVHTQRTHMHSYAYTPTYAHRDTRADGLLVISRGTTRFLFCFLSFFPLSSFSPLSLRLSK